MCVVGEDRADVYVVTHPRGRRERLCSECFAVIQVGERYARHAYLFDGSWSTSVLCALCDRLGEAVNAADCSWGLGSLEGDAEQTLSSGYHDDADPAALGTVAGLLFRLREERGHA